MRIRILTSLLIFAFSYSAQAIVYVHSCPLPRKTISLVEHESEYRYGNKLIRPAGTYEAVLSTIFAELKQINPSRASLYPDWLKKIQGTMDFRSGMVFPPAKPEVDAELETGCELKMLVYRRKTSIAGQKEYVVDKDLWSSLSPISQATAMLELIVMDERRANGFYGVGVDDSSPRSRFGTSFFASEKISSISLRDFFSATKELGLTEFDYRGVPFNGNSDLKFIDADTPGSQDLERPRVMKPKEATTNWLGAKFSVDLSKWYKGVCPDGDLIGANFLPNTQRVTFTTSGVEFSAEAIQGFQKWCGFGIDLIEASSVTSKQFPHLTCQKISMDSSSYGCGTPKGMVEFNGIKVTDIQSFRALNTGEVQNVVGKSNLTDYLGYTGTCAGEHRPKSINCNPAVGSYKTGSGRVIPVSREIFVNSSAVRIDGTSYPR